jgi:polysaccharide biosynthesis protein PslG
VRGITTWALVALFVLTACGAPATPAASGPIAAVAPPAELAYAASAPAAAPARVDTAPSASVAAQDETSPTAEALEPPAEAAPEFGASDAAASAAPAEAPSAAAQPAPAAASAGTENATTAAAAPSAVALPVRAPVARPAADARYFAGTGYRVSNRYFFRYFQQHGGSRTLGQPISNQFRYLGFPVQLYEARMLLLQPDNTIFVVPLGNSDAFPFTTVNGMTIPPNDPSVSAIMPQDPNAPDYSQQTLAAVYQVVPDTMPDGTAVNFLTTYLNAVTYQEAFPAGDQPQELLPYVAFQIWGRPLTQATADPNNPSMIYQRFENGIMAYDGSTGTTSALPVGSWLAALLTGQNVPSDLAAAAAGGRFANQYQAGAPAPALARPDALPDSDLTNAFAPPPAPTDWSALTATFAGAPLQAPSPDYGVSVFVWGEQAATSRIINQVKDLGFHWVRQLFQWQAIEGADKGQFDWSEADRVVKAANDAGVKIIARLDFAPDWSQAVPVPNGPPDDINDFGDFVNAFVARYGPGSSQGVGRVDAIEVWNEPNLAREWGGKAINQDQAGAYVNMLRIAYEAAKAADPGITVISAGLTPTGTDDDTARPDDVYLQWMYDAGAGAYFDVLGAHGAGYKAPPDMSPDAVAADQSFGGHPSFSFRRVEQLRDVMVRNGDSGKQVWLLEFGWTSDEVNPAYAWHRVTEQQKADYIVGAYQWARNNWSPWIGVMTLWNLSAPGWTRNNEEYWWSITNPDGSTRPAYDALKAARQNGTLP